jgi:transcription elongation factor Elf1
MQQYYDYCDTYESYDSGLALDNKNKIRTFSCNVCKQSKFVLKKSVRDPVFKCEECIQQQQQDQDQGQQETTWKWFSFF